MIDIALLLVFGTFLVWIGSEWLESASVGLAKYYDVPSIVRGSLITAFGSSFPEFSSIILATVLHGELELGISIVLGSAIFNLLVIPGLAGIKSGGLDLQKRVVSREISIYSAVVIAVTAFFYASLLIDRGELSFTGETSLSPLLSVLLIGFYGIYVVYQVRISQSTGSEEDVNEDFNKFHAFGKLVLSLILIGVGVEALVRAVIDLGVVLNTPSFFWGLIIVAGCSSLPDAFVSVKQAGNEDYSASITNVMGSNIFDLLVVLGTGVLVSGGILVNLSSVTPLLISLLLATVIVLAVVRRGDSVSKNESSLLLLTYLLFVVWVMLEAFGYIGLIGL